MDGALSLGEGNSRAEGGSTGAGDAEPWARGSDSGVQGTLTLLGEGGTACRLSCAPCGGLAMNLLPVGHDGGL